ncbi:MAG: hypothetical protein LBQ75_02985, partial [Zoogloeaceae bacterium]|nr:hypothetical protein [Zoogloeaceae bacterium]
MRTRQPPTSTRSPNPSPASGRGDKLRPLRRFSENGEERLEILDQTCLPYRKYWQRLESLKEVI